MLKINFPDSFIPERKYVIDVLFGEFLAVNYTRSPKEGIVDYEIECSEGKIIIKDNFFGRFYDKTNYINKQSLPEKVFVATNKLFNNGKLTVLYGDDYLEVDGTSIRCGYDIFASAFFMLTRWEEAVDSQCDDHERFVEEHLVCIKNNFYKNAVVDEYVDFLWDLLLHFNYKGQRKQRKRIVVPTHDIDFFERFHNTNKIVRALAGDLLKRKSVSEFTNTVKQNIKIKRGLIKDPYDTFDFLMDLSERQNLQSRFYFIAGKLGEFDVHYNIDHLRVQKKIKHIINRGHIIGIHGSYNSFNNPKQFKIEQERLQNITKSNVKEGRQHFLRFNNPKTWQMYEKSGIAIDSSLGFSRHIGYRCGTGETFSVFDIIKRKKMQLKEMPLVVMDRVTTIENGLFEFGGQFTTLWHNSTSSCEIIESLIRCNN